jgi:hypothetical protein
MQAITFSRFLACSVAVMSIALAACPNPPQTGSNPSPPSMIWTILDETRKDQAQNLAAGTSTIIAGSGAYLIGVQAQSPDGITEMTLSGSGSFACFLNSKNAGGSTMNPIGTQSYTAPYQDAHQNPPQTQVSLSDNLTIPCVNLNPNSVAGFSNVIGQPAGQSYVTFTATATNASGHTITGTLSLSVYGTTDAF